MNWLFDTSLFIPRSQCGEWDHWLIITAIFADISIAITYYLILIQLYLFYRVKKTDYTHSWMILLFIAFIFTSGTIHIVDAITYYNPIYRALVLVSAITALVSLITSILLPKVLHALIIIPSVQNLDKINKELLAEIDKRKLLEENVRNLNHELANRVHILQNRLLVQGWITEKQLDIDKMKNIISELRKNYKKSPPPEGE